MALAGQTITIEQRRRTRMRIAGIANHTLTMDQSGRTDQLRTKQDLMLIVFGGLPGTGKTTIARAIATRRSATYLRIDAIEQAIRNAGVLAAGVGPAGYAVANVLAEANLANGRMVVTDCVNPVAESREAWRAIASRTQTRLIEVEIICSDPLEHRRRVEGRMSDIPGLVVPTWQSVLDREYAVWQGPHLIVDTARLPSDEAIAAVERHIDT
jgi:predicted kinase